MGDLKELINKINSKLEELTDLGVSLKDFELEFNKIIESRKEMNDEKEDKPDPFEIYWNDIQEANDDHEACFLNSYSDISVTRVSIGSVKETYTDESYCNAYQNYVNKEYATMARKAKKFHDICIAWKWCYERDITVDFLDDSTNKFMILYDYERSAFSPQISVSRKIPNAVYFKNRDVCEKLCIWLNKHKDELDLEV